MYMADRISPERRSWLMSRVAAKNTTPELAVRRQAHAMGLRFRLHRRDMPGSPDLVFPKYRTVVFVHGCFWHRHVGCSKATMPTSSVEYWSAKFERNLERDAWALQSLEKAGWRVLTIWECDAKHPDKIAIILARVADSEKIYGPSGGMRFAATSNEHLRYYASQSSQSAIGQSR